MLPVVPLNLDCQVQVHTSSNTLQGEDKTFWFEYPLFKILGTRSISNFGFWSICIYIHNQIFGGMETRSEHETHLCYVPWRHSLKVMSYNIFNSFVHETKFHGLEPSTRGVQSTFRTFWVFALEMLILYHQPSTVHPKLQIGAEDWGRWPGWRWGKSFESRDWVPSGCWRWTSPLAGGPQKPMQRGKHCCVILCKKSTRQLLNKNKALDEIFVLWQCRLVNSNLNTSLP